MNQAQFNIAALKAPTISLDGFAMSLTNIRLIEYDIPINYQHKIYRYHVTKVPEPGKRDFVFHPTSPSNLLCIEASDTNMLKPEPKYYPVYIGRFLYGIIRCVYLDSFKVNFMSC
ncbi:hypothetical protein FQA39_LY12591 [Lamprigera yunnana]|nr:hypothetical protein FQA39_LY12591 [Lamprigera yunnana]